MIVLDDEAVLRLVSPPALVPLLQHAFLEPAVTPPRFHGDLPGADNAKLLIMPSWADRQAIGIKIVAAIPSNATRGQPTIDGVYVLMDGETGQPLAVMSARALTSLRTAAVCALATSVLARQDSSVLLMIGTGALAPHLVRAYLAVRPLQRVILWGRNVSKANALAEQLSGLDVELSVASELTGVLRTADIISCATLATTPLINGHLVAPGTHIDLVGSFTPQMREADSELFRRGRLVVDSSTALQESGDLIVPLREGVIKDSIPDLSAVLSEPGKGRTQEAQITVFKSVGTGLADLAVARHVFEQHQAAQLNLPLAGAGI